MTVELNLALLATRSRGSAVGLEAVAQTVQAGGADIYGYQVGFGSEPLARWAKPLSAAPRELQLAYEQRNLLMMVRDQAGELEYQLRLNWWDEADPAKTRVHVGAVCFQSALFNGPSAETYSATWLHLGIVLYEAVRPDFGWTDLSDPAGYTWFDHLDTLALPHLYWANFFGPSYVRKLGRDVLLSAPAWHSRELSDGGFLLALSPAVGQGGAKLNKQAILVLQRDFRTKAR